VDKVIEDGTSNRTVAATKYNSESSRSHAVFELHIQQKYNASGIDMQSRTKIAMIDLAGSERSVCRHCRRCARKSESRPVSMQIRQAGQYGQGAAGGQQHQQVPHCAGPLHQGTRREVEEDKGY
jgi:hypothetical protein